MSNKKEKKDYHFLIPSKTCVISTFQSRTPREAALKAATMNMSEDILLVNQQKLHIFKGEKKMISEAELTPFMRLNHIQFKPTVQKMAMINLPFSPDFKSKTDIAKIIAVFHD